MPRIEKTVFISYRRTNAPWALAIYQNLTTHGYDVFFDFTSIASGDFEQVILENIKARAHFVVLLTPSALDRCGEPNDLLRREIETALVYKRNIAPLMLEGFDFGTPAIATQLTGQLALLKQYSALHVPTDYFDVAMERLRTTYLNVALETVLHPLTNNAKQATKAQQRSANAAKAVPERELSAQEWFERGYEIDDNSDEELYCYDEAIRLKPDYTIAYYNRGVVHNANGDLDAALHDYNEAIHLNPDDAEAYNNRGLVHDDQGNLDAALRDYNDAIRLNPDEAAFYYNRGNVYFAEGSLDAALRDYNDAIHLKLDLANAYYNRGNVYSAKGNLEAAIRDYNEAIRLKPDLVDVYNNRGVVRKATGKIDAALRDYNEAIRLKPDYTTAYKNRGHAHKAKGNRNAAIRDFQRYLSLGGGIQHGDQAEVEKMIQDLHNQR